VLRREIVRRPGDRTPYHSSGRAHCPQGADTNVSPQDDGGDDSIFCVKLIDSKRFRERSRVYGS